MNNRQSYLGTLNKAVTNRLLRTTQNLENNGNKKEHKISLEILKLIEKQKHLL